MTKQCTHVRAAAWATASVAYAYALWLVSIQPPTDLPSTGPGALGEMLHNSLHAPAYGILTFLLAMTLRNFHPRAYLIAAVWGAFAYGVGMEILQSQTPGRTASLLDALLNLMGCLLAAVLWKGLATRKSHTS